MFSGQGPDGVGGVGSEVHQRLNHSAPPFLHHQGEGWQYLRDLGGCWSFGDLLFGLKILIALLICIRCCSLKTMARSFVCSLPKTLVVFSQLPRRWSTNRGCGTVVNVLWSYTRGFAAFVRQNTEFSSRGK